MIRIGRFIKTALTYLAGNIFSKLITFFLIPLYTNKLTTSDYGNYDVATTVITLLVSVAFFQIWDGMFRMSFDTNTERDKFSVIGICFRGYGAGIILFSLSYFIIARLLSFDFIILPLVFGIIYGLQYMYSFSTRVFLNNKLFVVSGTINTLVIALTNIILILFFHVGVQALYIAQILGAIAQILIIEFSIHLLSNIKNINFDSDQLKRILKFSFPLCIATVSYWLLSGYTKISIKLICGAEDNGLFAIASSLSNMAVIAVNVFQFAWNETAYLMANENNRVNTYKKCLDLLFCTVWISCAGFCTAVKIIYPYYVGHDFQASSIVVPYLMIGVSANAIAGFLGTLFMTEQKTTFIMVSTFVASALNICFSQIMTREYGLIGAVLVLTASFATLMILRLIQIKRTLSVSISWKVIPSVIPVVFSVILYIKNVSLWINVCFLLALIIMYVLMFQIITEIKINAFIKHRSIM